MNNFIPVWKYAKDKGISRQTIYRWIREKKVPPEKLKIVERVVKRIEIDSDYKK